MGLFGSQPLVDLNRGPQMDPLDVNVPRRPNAGDWFFSPDQSTTRGKLGLLGEYLMGASGGPLASLGNGLLGMRQQGQADEQQRMEAERQAANDDMRNRYMEAQIGAMTVPKDTRTSLLKEMEAAGIDPKSQEGRLIIARSATGYGYSDEAQAQKIETERELARIRAENRAPTGQLGAGERARYINDAEAAIARGAPRDKVYARLRQMGVN